MSILYKIITIAIVTTFASVVVKKTHPEYAVALGITASVIIFYFMAESFSEIFYKIKNMMEKASVETSYITAILKITAIAYLSEYTGAILEDAGETALSKKVEMAGKIIIFLITLPVIEALLTLILSLL